MLNNTTNLQIFFDCYAKHLTICREKYPMLYTWPVSELPAVLERAEQAIKIGGFHKDSPAFKATCKELNIKRTYRDIKKFIDSAGE